MKLNFKHEYIQKIRIQIMFRIKYQFKINLIKIKILFKYL